MITLHLSLWSSSLESQLLHSDSLSYRNYILHDKDKGPLKKTHSQNSSYMVLSLQADLVLSYLLTDLIVLLLQ
jgi:hypothetical protein